MARPVWHMHQNAEELVLHLAKLLSKGAVPFYIPTSNASRCLLVHGLANSVYCQPLGVLTICYDKDLMGVLFFI